MSETVDAATLEQSGLVPTNDQHHAEVSTTANAETAGGETDPQANANSGEPETEEQREKRLSGFQREKAKRIRAEQEAEYWRKEAMRHQPKDTPDPQSKAQEKTAESEEFDPDKFLEQYQQKHPDHSYERAVAAMTAEVTRRESGRTLKQQQEAETRRQKEAEHEKAFLDRVEKAKTAYADFEEVAFDPEVLEVVQKHPNIDGYIANVPNGLELLYALGKDKAELDRIAALPGIEQLEALFALKSKLASPQSTADQPAPPPAAVQTRAPKPLSPTRKTSTVDDGELSDDLPPEKWKERFLKKMEKR